MKITRSEYHQVAGLLMLSAYHSERQAEIKKTLESLLKLEPGLLYVSDRRATTDEFLAQFDIEAEAAG